MQHLPSGIFNRPPASGFEYVNRERVTRYRTALKKWCSSFRFRWLALGERSWIRFFRPRANQPKRFSSQRPCMKLVERKLVPFLNQRQNAEIRYAPSPRNTAAILQSSKLPRKSSIDSSIGRGSSPISPRKLSGKKSKFGFSEQFRALKLSLRIGTHRVAASIFHL